MGNWERRGSFWFCRKDDWEYLVHQTGDLWRLAQRAAGDSKWETITHYLTADDAKGAI
jgi:hypothetical protein